MICHILFDAGLMDSGFARANHACAGAHGPDEAQRAAKRACYSAFHDGLTCCRTASTLRTT